MHNRFNHIILAIALAIFMFGCSESAPPSGTTQTSTSQSTSTAADQNTSTVQEAAAAEPVKPRFVDDPSRRWPFNREASAHALDDGLKSTVAVSEENMFDTTYVLVIDGSGSMRDNGYMQPAIEAAIEWVGNLKPSDNVGLLCFHHDTWTVVPITKDRKKLISTIKGLTAKGGTPLGTSTQFGYYMLTEHAIKQGGYGSYVLVQITDGEPSGTDRQGRDQEDILEEWVGTVTTESPVRVQTIGFGDYITASHPLNRNGITIFTIANDIDALRRDLAKTLEIEPDNYDASLAELSHLE